MVTTAPTEKPSAPIERTEHPYVVKSADILDGEPRVDSMRMPVRRIAALFAAGSTGEEMARAFR